MPRPADIYFRFLQLADAIQGLPALGALDPLEEKIVKAIALASKDGVHHSVRGFMETSGLASPATLHSRLKSLRRKGWLSLLDSEEGQKKNIELTPAAYSYFDSMSEMFTRAVAERDKPS